MQKDAFSSSNVCLHVRVFTCSSNGSCVNDSIVAAPSCTLFTALTLPCRLLLLPLIHPQPAVLQVPQCSSLPGLQDIPTSETVNKQVRLITCTPELFSPRKQPQQLHL